MFNVIIFRQFPSTSFIRILDEMPLVSDEKYIVKHSLCCSSIEVRLQKLKYYKILRIENISRRILAGQRKSLNAKEGSKMKILSFIAA